MAGFLLFFGRSLGLDAWDLDEEVAVGDLRVALPSVSLALIPTTPRFKTRLGHQFVLYFDSIEDRLFGVDYLTYLQGIL